MDRQNPGHSIWDLSFLFDRSSLLRAGESYMNLVIESLLVTTARFDSVVWLPLLLSVDSF